MRITPRQLPFLLDPQHEPADRDLRPWSELAKAGLVAIDPELGGHRTVLGDQALFRLLVQLCGDRGLDVQQLVKQLSVAGVALPEITTEQDSAIYALAVLVGNDDGAADEDGRASLRAAMGFYYDSWPEVSRKEPASVLLEEAGLLRFADSSSCDTCCTGLGTQVWAALCGMDFNEPTVNNEVV